MDDIFFQLLGKDTIALTANRRLASYLQDQYAQYQKSQQKKVWITPSILPLSAWLINLWQSVNSSKTALNTIQEHCLWKTISQQPWSSIQTIQQAWKTLQDWAIDLTSLKAACNDSVKYFCQWIENFTAYCQENAWISLAEIPHQLLTKDLTTYLPKSIVLIGFDEFPPIIAKLLQRLQDQCHIKVIEASTLKSKVKRFELEDQESELYAMASWAFKEHQKNSSKKIACVIPNLTNIRPIVVRIFSEVFSNTPTFNLSAGQHLNEFSMIQTALLILREEWQALLQSPYLMQSDNDYDLCAHVDKIRRLNNLTHLDSHSLLTLFTSIQPRFPQSTFLKRLNRLLQFKKTLPELQSLTQWLESFTKILTILEWPGARTLSSTEHQVLQRWLKVQEELIQCSLIFDEMNYENALAILNHYISQVIFQPKSTETAIQILGILEIADLSFDAIWIMGLDNENWPPTASPNPFLPYALQMQNDMPHASAERELIFTKKTMQRLLSSANEVYLSNSKTAGDKILAPSSLINAFELNSLTDNKYMLPSLVLTNNQEHIENFSDHFGTPLSSSERVKGGTAILKYQAICPFKAYASFRLAAEPLETPDLGLSAKLRGQLLHQTLELIWKKIQTQKRLLTMNTEQLKKTISNAVNTAIDTQPISKSDTAFLPVEKKRLYKIISEWLVIEKERPPFSVTTQENTQQVSIGTLSFQCRIDRIDKLENNAYVVIDYKSGLSSIHDWFTERPPEPQLPIYCIFTNKKAYDGIAFAQIRAGAMQLKGLINENQKNMNNTNIVNINRFDNADNINCWNSLVIHWKKTLENLSYSFCQGQANVDPLASACNYCQLQALCRVNECQN